MADFRNRYDQGKNQRPAYRIATTPIVKSSPISTPIDSEPSKESNRFGVIFFGSIGVIALLIVLGLIGSYYYKEKQFITKVPDTLRQEYTYPIYYPSKLPQGYSYQEGSGRVAGDVVFYSLNSSEGKVSISEQELPERLPDVNFQNSVQVDTPHGKATIGKSTLGTLVVLKTKDTLINLSSSGNISQDRLAEIISSLRTVQ